MSKNLISVVTEALGVELEEEFSIKGVDNHTFFIDTEGYVQCFETNSRIFNQDYMGDYDLQYLLRNPDMIITVAFKPKHNDKYWTYYGPHFWVGEAIWYEEVADYERKVAGIVFRTEEEAIEARPAKYKELTGKEWESR